MSKINNRKRPAYNNDKDLLYKIEPFYQNQH